ncbi:hypothetical protein EB796_005883 [Bugula neritina]|uniref:Uncharacterized protein n=1 Tax=Bugula neritina TaxID=10212 RepID=A0A7J7KE40_BUGNE|nr:hypothetical protein EB796_005883 [Bugula neritina]
MYYVVIIITLISFLLIAVTPFSSNTSAWDLVVLGSDFRLGYSHTAAAPRSPYMVSINISFAYRLRIITTYIVSLVIKLKGRESKLVQCFNFYVFYNFHSQA